MEDIIVTERFTIPASELDVSFARSSGPGGQNVNKVNSKVTMHWRLQESQFLPEPIKQRLVALAGSRFLQDGSIQVASQEFRDQPGNLRSCQEKLRKLVLAALQPVKCRRPTKPSKASHRRRLNDKKLQSQKKSGRGSSSWE